MADRIWKKEEVAKFFHENDGFTCRCMVKLYEHQTADERASEETKYHNRIGVRPADARVLSQFTSFYIRRHFLSVKQLAFLRKRMNKYVAQLTDIANGKR